MDAENMGQSRKGFALSAPHHGQECQEEHINVEPLSQRRPNSSVL